MAQPAHAGAGGLYLRLDGRLVPLMMEGRIVAAFLPGWRAALLHTGFAPLFLLELAHEDGRRATWFLDWRMQRVGDAIDRLGPELLDLLRRKALPVLGRLLAGVLEEATPSLDADALAFLELNEATRQAIAFACLDGLLRRPAMMLVGDLMEASLTFRDGNDGALRAIARAQLAAAFAVDWQSRLPDAFGSGALTWPSPVDGTPLRAQGCLCIDDFHFAYRFHDAEHGLVFFVMIAEHHSRVGGVWFPSLGLMVAPEQERTQGIAQIQLLPHLAHWIVQHVCVWAGLLVPYLQQGATRFASVMRGRNGVHIGHQLWNELSGIDHLLAASAPLPAEWIVLDAVEHTELYGPIDVLYPALHGRVRRDLASVGALIRYTYETGTMTLRVAHEHVSGNLRGRILERLRGSVAEREAARVCDRSRGPVILLGLRVENRTLTDLAGFLERLAGSIAHHFEDAVLVLDGHNARNDTEDGRVIASHGESRAMRSPVEVERELARRLRARFEGRRLHVADTIGRPIGTSLAWAARCDCFVSIWGASLAKYRWVCNKRGLVLTSRHNLAHRGDLHIYDAPHYMEAPTPLAFVEADLVVDRPEAPLLVDVAPGQASFRNFDVDEARLFPAIARMIQASRT